MPCDISADMTVFVGCRPLSMYQARYFLCWQALLETLWTMRAPSMAASPHDGFDTGQMIIAVLPVGVHTPEMCHAFMAADNFESHATYQGSHMDGSFVKPSPDLHAYIYIQ